MATVITNGQSFSDVAAMVTISPEYGPAIAAENNMPGQDISGKRYWVDIPDSWMKPEYAGKKITLPPKGKGDSIVWIALAAVGAYLLLK